ncbi:hypothetical protein LMG23994_01691 [Cupriavidus pinatubonensis]|uniref:Uncharacterized protein n=1 Tax=Cupriavidus pinatubonensis TaxID=248026 RepID=A0ABN7Y8Z2_9BURK|nr:hypothetical protein LMG23994_01691 [Cupriavidus pinatubonensis]
MTNKQPRGNACRRPSEKHALRTRGRDEHARSNDVNTTALKLMNEAAEIRVKPNDVPLAEGTQRVAQDFRRLTSYAAICFDHSEWLFDGVPDP